MPQAEKVVPPVRVYGGLLSWRFSGVDKGGPYSWTMDSETHRAIVERLAQFEGMPQDKIASTGSHAIAIDRLSKEAKERLAEIKLDDLDEVMSFRMTGRERVICRQSGPMMFILWWDPEHAVCPALLKHT